MNSFTIKFHTPSLHGFDTRSVSLKDPMCHPTQDRPNTLTLPYQRSVPFPFNYVRLTHTKFQFLALSNELSGTFASRDLI